MDATTAKAKTEYTVSIPTDGVQYMFMTMKKGEEMPMLATKKGGDFVKGQDRWRRYEPEVQMDADGAQIDQQVHADDAERE